MGDDFDMIFGEVEPSKVATRTMGDNDFDMFDGTMPAATAAKVLLPRAHEHPHFTSCAGIWPEASSCETGSLETLGRAYADERMAIVSSGLRKSLSPYARDCAKSIVAACMAYTSGGSAAAQVHAEAARDLCATAIEEANWDVGAWQEANLMSLGFLLAAMLEGALPAAGSESECLGAAAIALFNLAVAAACAQTSTPRWMAWVGSLLQRAEAAVGTTWHSSLHSHVSSSTEWQIPVSPAAHRLPPLPAASRVTEVDAAALGCASFFREYLQPGRPVLIRGHLAAEQWAALDYFADLRALHAEAGRRLVPINLGSPLVGYGGVVHWPLARLIEERLLPSNTTDALLPPTSTAPADEEVHCQVAYCSQHHLLHQHPPLQSLLAVPPFTVGRTLSPANLWIGTRGTVTSLHSDPSDNLLCQVAGFKYFRLYALDQTPKLYATTQRANNANSFGTSPVRPEAELPPEHSLFADAQYVEGLLAPGDILFIPKSVWHYVRSVTTSVSVNFWF